MNWYLLAALALPLTPLASSMDVGYALGDAGVLIEKQTKDGSATNTDSVIQYMRLAIDSICALNDTVNSHCDPTAAYNGSQLISLLAKTDAVNYALSNATESLNSTTQPLDCVDSLRAWNSHHILSPAARGMLVNFEQHYEAFNRTGIVSSVYSSINHSRSVTEDFTYALGARLAEDEKAEINGPNGRTQVLSAFDQALMKFSK